MSTDIDEIVIRRFHAMFGAPNTGDIPIFLDEYRTQLAGTDRQILADAVTRAIGKHGYRSWPTVAEVKRLVDAVATDRMNARKREPEPGSYRRPPTADEKARVDALVKAMAAKLKANRDDNPKAAMTAEEWALGAKPAWDERMETSETARQLAMPKGWRG